MEDIHVLVYVGVGLYRIQSSLSALQEVTKNEKISKMLYK